jgi:hypothetical protein
MTAIPSSMIASHYGVHRKLSPRESVTAKAEVRRGDIDEEKGKEREAGRN